MYTRETVLDMVKFRRWIKEIEADKARLKKYGVPALGIQGEGEEICYPQ